MECLSNTYKLFINVYKMDKQYEYQSFGILRLLIPKVKVDYSLIPLKQLSSVVYVSQVSPEKEYTTDYKNKGGYLLRQRKSRSPKQRTIEIIFEAANFTEAEKKGLELCSKHLTFLPFLFKRKVRKRIATMKTRL